MTMLFFLGAGWLTRKDPLPTLWVVAATLVASLTAGRFVAPEGHRPAVR